MFKWLGLRDPEQTFADIVYISLQAATIDQSAPRANQPYQHHLFSARLELL